MLKILPCIHGLYLISVQQNGIREFLTDDFLAVIYQIVLSNLDKNIWMPTNGTPQHVSLADFVKFAEY